jgi:hypothetical protein
MNVVMWQTTLYWLPNGRENIAKRARQGWKTSDFAPQFH